MPKNTTFFYKNLIHWYLQNKRSLPWRETKDPYKIWLSEIILQQTRVVQGLPYYLKFISAFPNVHELAEASEESVLKLWQGLGYYSRARNLHETARFVANKLNGVFPTDYKGLLQLKGVGDYTASAIASICYDEATAVVDGNVYRVLSRVFGLETPINSTAGIREFKTLAQLLIDPEQPGTFNQAVMEFGARFCVPRNPDCGSCIFSDKCVAKLTNKVTDLPVKPAKTKIKKHYYNYIVPVSGDQKTILEQRTGRGIWQNLYQFPLIESPSEAREEELRYTSEFKILSKKYNFKSLSLYTEIPLVHKLSHKHLHTRFWIAESESLEENGIPMNEVHQYPVPVLIENFISDFSLFQN